MFLVKLILSLTSIFLLVTILVAFCLVVGFFFNARSLDRVVGKGCIGCNGFKCAVPFMYFTSTDLDMIFVTFNCLGC